MSRSLKAALLAAAVVVSGFAADAQAQAKPEDLLKMRQGLMQAVKTSFGPIAAFAQGKADLPADAAAKAEALAALAKLAPMGWGKGSEALEGSKTKAEAFGSADFAKGWEAMEVAAKALSVAAASGSPEAIKAAFPDVAKTCKSCHDSFKKD